MASYQELKSLDLGDLGCRLGQNATHTPIHLKLDGDDSASRNSENLCNNVTPINILQSNLRTSHHQSNQELRNIN